MKLTGQLVFGGLIILWGVLILVSNIFDIDFGIVCWPLFFIILGVWLILRPKFEARYPDVKLLILGDYHEKGNWQVKDREHLAFIGNYKLDMQQAVLLPGLTTLKFFGFVQEVKLTIPNEMGIAVTSNSFVSDMNIYGEKRDGVFWPAEFTSSNYSSAERKLRIECTGFVSTIKVKTPAT
jgi:predicted membrane protein